MNIQLRNRIFIVADSQYNEAWEHINSGKWEPRTFEILDYFVGRDDTVLDLGAWIGAVSLYASHLASEVYAVEPDPVAFPFLEKNVLLNPGLKLRIKCFKLAISSKRGQLILYARDQYGVSSSSLLPRIRDGLSAEIVKGITLKEFIDSKKIKKIDFIKMDIEGGEFELIPAIADDLKKLNFPTLFISFHYNYLVEHQYRTRVKSKLLSRLMIKLERWSGIELFGKTSRIIVLDALKCLKDYRYIYNESGHELSHALIQSDPSLIKKHNLVFTNKIWVRNKVQ